MKIDFSKPVGPFKHLNGINLGPTMNNVYSYELTKELYRKLNCSCVRLHDAPLFNPAMKLVDIHQIFANFNAAPDDPANYYFAQTDDYIKSCLDLGMQVEYRLGESIEHSANKYFIHPPGDFAKWASICSHIVAHYNEGWADGFRWNLKYWVIWCEPNEWKIWSGTEEEYFRLYSTAAKILKKEHPEIRVGGPAWGGGAYALDKIEAFLAHCRQEQAPVDFVAWNQYSTLIPLMLETPFKVRELAERYGYGDAELHLGEWHYLNRAWREIKNPASDATVMDPVFGVQGFDAAAYAASVLIGLEDTPQSLAFFYHGTCGKFGILDDAHNPSKLYYALEAYGTLMRCPERVRCETDTLSPVLQHDLNSQKGDLMIMAGRDGQKRGTALISAFFVLAQELTVEVSGMEDFDVSILVVDKFKTMEHAVFRREGNTLRIRKPSSSAVYLLEFAAR